MKFVALALALAVVTVQPAASAPLQPTGRWVVDFGDSRCIAWRNFGSEKDPVHLLIKPSAVDGVLQLSMAEIGAHSDYAKQEPMTLRFDTGQQLTLSQLLYSSEGKQVRLVNLTKEQAGELARASSVQWSAKRKQYEFSLGSMSQLMKVTEDCRATLAKFWNATAEKQALLKSGPSPVSPIKTLFGPEAFPTRATFEGQSGITKVAALIDESGGIADCVVIEPSGIASLDVRTCPTIRKRSKFSPAIDKDGKPTKGVFTQYIRWELP